VPAEDLVPPKGDFRLGVSDSVEIELMNVANARQICKIMPDGMLYYLMLHGIKAEGLTLPELKTQIQNALTDLYRQPQVTIVLREVSSQRVWVLGRVNTSGLYPLAGPMTVLEAISRAGGLFTSRFSGTTEELADLRHSFFVRDGQFVPVDFYKLLREGDLSQNIYLKNGDYIYLPSALSNEVYILGAVRNPKAIGFNDQVTVVSAIAEAKGILPNAYSQRIVIIRGSLNKPLVATVNLNEIMHGRATDVILQPRDIVWIPNSPWDRVDSYEKVIVNTFVRTVAANEGGRAASEQSTPVQSAVPLSTVSTTTTAAPVSSAPVGPAQ
jgi:polysaccharide export outer membrane protein